MIVTVAGAAVRRAAAIATVMPSLARVHRETLGQPDLEDGSDTYGLWSGEWPMCTVAPSDLRRWLDDIIADVAALPREELPS